MNFLTTASRRWFLGIPLVVMLLMAAWLSLAWGIASLDAWRAVGISVRLLKEPRPGPAELAEWRRALDLIEQAERWRGTHPDTSDLRGQLLQWEAVHFAGAGPERVQRLQGAIEQYRIAVTMRPAWPYFWANLAIAKAEAGLFDEEFQKAVRRVAETGPWERQIQLQMIRLDFVEGARLDDGSRAFIAQMMENAVQTQPTRVMALAGDFQQMSRICTLVQDPRLERRCAPYRIPVETNDSKTGSRKEQDG